MLRALGWPARRVANAFLGEGALVAIAGALIGSAAAVAYCALVLYGLRTWWHGAVGTTELRLFVNPATLLEGALTGFVMGLLAIWWTLRSVRKLSPRALLSGVLPLAVERGPRKITKYAALSATEVAFTLLAAGALRAIDPAAAFFGGAALLLTAGLLWTSVLVRSARHSVLSLEQGHSLWKLGARSTAFRPGRAVAGIALIASATFLIVGLDAFRQPVADSSDPHSGTGGFALAAESELPIFYDPNSAAGRESLNLTSHSADLSGAKF